MEQKEIIVKIADDVWAIAKELKDFKTRENLKTISACLHDLRSGRDAGWYMNRKFL